MKREADKPSEQASAEGGPLARRQLVLIGYRGTGKTTVAASLAARLGCPWRDADVEIQRRAGKTIQAIFAEDGEPAFRDWESEVVADWAGQANTVLALGGGAILRESNREAIAGSVVIWLAADADTIAGRLASDPVTAERRPQLTGLGGRAEIEELLRRREPIYRDCADFVVDTTGKPPDQVADEIVCLVRQASDPDHSAPT